MTLIEAENASNEELHNFLQTLSYADEYYFFKDLSQERKFSYLEYTYTLPPEAFIDRNVDPRKTNSEKIRKAVIVVGCFAVFAYIIIKLL